MFLEAYKRCYWLVETISRKYSAKYGEDVDDLKSFLNSEFWITYNNFDSRKGKLETFMSISLQRRLDDYMKLKRNEFHRNLSMFSELYMEDEEGKEVEMEFEDKESSVEEIVEKKEMDGDKRQLIHVLLENADPLTMSIAREFLEDDNATPTAIGRKLGVHHQTVRRKLDALANKYYKTFDEDVEVFLAV